MEIAQTVVLWTISELAAELIPLKNNLCVDTRSSLITMGTMLLLSDVTDDSSVFS